MKRYLIFIALLGLGFGACKKEQAVELEQEKVILIAGEKYTVDYIQRGIAFIFGIPKDSLAYDDATQVFYPKGYDLATIDKTAYNGIFKPEKFINDIKSLERDGFKF